MNVFAGIATSSPGADSSARSTSSIAVVPDDDADAHADTPQYRRTTARTSATSAPPMKADRRRRRRSPRRSRASTARSLLTQCDQSNGCGNGLCRASWRVGQHSMVRRQPFLRGPADIVAGQHRLARAGAHRLSRGSIGQERAECIRKGKFVVNRHDRPLTPSSMIASVAPARRVAIDGRPHAIASRSASGCASRAEGRTKISAARSSAPCRWSAVQTRHRRRGRTRRRPRESRPDNDSSIS